MNLNQFRKRFQTYNQIIPILTENGIPFAKFDCSNTVIWLKDAAIYLYPSDKYSVSQFNFNQNIKDANYCINTEKEYIQYFKEKYMISKETDYIEYGEEYKTEIIISTHLIETAEYYESRTI